jgi:hypothetical protein
LKKNDKYRVLISRRHTYKGISQAEIFGIVGQTTIVLQEADNCFAVGIFGILYLRVVIGCFGITYLRGADNCFATGIFGIFAQGASGVHNLCDDLASKLKKFNMKFFHESLFLI